VGGKEQRAKREPRWLIEARARGIDFIVLVYEKAEGFVFCPTDPEHLFRVGGDYNGAYPVTATSARRYLDRDVNRAFHDRVMWFSPFLDKILAGEDFSLDDLDLEHRRARTLEGRWPW